MADPRISKLAKLLTHYCVEVKPGDKVIISSAFAALPLVEETYREVVKAGGHALTFWQPDSLGEIRLREATDEQLAFIHEPQKMIYETYDCSISIRSSENTRTLSGIDPAREAIASKAGRALLETTMKRSAAG